MKKVVILVFPLIIFSFYLVKDVVLASTIDQACFNKFGGEYDIYRPGSDKLGQSFTPTKNRLTKASINVRGVGGGNFHVDLYRGGDFVTSSQVVAEPSGTQNVMVNFSPEISMTPGDGSYKLVPVLEAENKELNWRYQNPCYSGGDGLSGSVLIAEGLDFGFATYGYDAESPPGENNPSAEQNQGGMVVEENINLGANQSLERSSAEEAVIDEQILLPPRNISGLALYKMNIVSWEPPENSEVDGYNVYRSTEENTGYELVVSYRDSDFNFINRLEEEEGIYYYYVRSTKGENESINSEVLVLSSGIERSTYVSSLWQMFSNSPLWLKVLSGAGLFLAFVATGYVIYKRIKK